MEILNLTWIGCPSSLRSFYGIKWQRSLARSLPKFCERSPVIYYFIILKAPNHRQKSRVVLLGQRRFKEIMVNLLMYQEYFNFKFHTCKPYSQLGKIWRRQKQEQVKVYYEERRTNFITLMSLPLRN